MDKLRARFEKRYRELMHDEYISDKEWAWKFYQASLADTEVCLPLTVENVSLSCAGYNLGIEDSEKAIRAAGIKVKE